MATRVLLSCTLYITSIFDPKGTIVKSIKVLVTVLLTALFAFGGMNAAFAEEPTPPGYQSEFFDPNCINPADPSVLDDCLQPKDPSQDPYCIEDSEDPYWACSPMDFDNDEYVPLPSYDHVTRLVSDPVEQQVADLANAVHALSTAVVALAIGLVLVVIQSISSRKKELF